MATATKTTTKPEAIACMYGNHSTGAGWIATKREPGNGSKLLGTGEPKQGRAFTEALWQAQAALREAGCSETDKMRVFAAGGKMYADLRVGQILRYGDLTWKAC